MTAITYYLRGQSSRRYTQKVEDLLVPDLIKQLESTNHVIAKTYNYKNSRRPDPNVFAVRFVAGPVIHEGLSEKDAESLAEKERLAHPGFKIVMFNKRHSDSIRKGRAGRGLRF